MEARRPSGAPCTAVRIRRSNSRAARSGLRPGRCRCEGRARGSDLCRHGAQDFVRGARRPRRPDRSRTRRARDRQGRRLRPLRRELPGVRDRRARDRALGRRRHDGQPAVHEGRRREAAEGLGVRACCSRRTALAPAWMHAIAGTAVEHVVTFDAPGGAAAQSAVALVAFETLAATRGAPPRVAIAPHDLVALPYSSGTTGLPKGVMLDARQPRREHPAGRRRRPLRRR